MAFDTTINSTPSSPPVYLDVVRLDDGRYCVRFVKNSLPPRTSYARHAGAVAQQAKRAGNVPVHTLDAELQRVCSDQQIDLLVEQPKEHLP